MAALTVIHDDGTAETLRPKASGLIEAEKRFGAKMPPIEGTLYACWWSTEARKSGVSFEDWADTISIDSEEGQTGPPPRVSPEP